MEQLFVRIFNKAESRFYPVENVNDIDTVLSNPNGHFEVEEINGEPVIYTALQVKARCNDKVRKYESSEINAESGILAKIAAAAQKASITPEVKASTVSENKVPEVLSGITGKPIGTTIKK